MVVQELKEYIAPIVRRLHEHISLMVWQLDIEILVLR